MKGLARNRALFPGLLLALALVSSLLHRRVAWEPARIDDHWVLEGDVHVHTSLAGALSTPLDIPLVADRNRLDFIAVTEHNAWLGGYLTEVAARELTPALIVLPSEEITNRAYHLLAIGLERRVDPTIGLAAIAADVHAQGGVVIAAHPTRATWPLLLGLADAHLLDGAEVFHPTIFRSETRAREHAEFLEEASKRSGRSLLAAGSSDYHGGSRLGVCRTIVLARERTAASVLEALHGGRAVAMTMDGRMAGNEEWIARLRAVDYAPREPTPPSGRWLAWIVFAVMIAALLRRE